MWKTEYFKVITWVFFAVCTLFFAGCTEIPTEVPSLLDPSNDYGQNPEEQKLISQAEEFEQQCRDDGFVLEDAKINEYLNSVGQKLIPESLEERINFHFVVIKDPTINAFALPNGGIYFHTGLLARLKNESQLAFIAAHEIAHVTERHMLETMYNLQNNTVKFKWAEMLVIPMMIPSRGPRGINSLAEINYLLAVNGYGRDKEKKADMIALKRIIQAGYDTAEAIETFSEMNEIHELGKLEEYYYSDHPTNEARKKYLEEIMQNNQLEGTAKGYVGADTYHAAIQGLLLKNINLRLSRKHYQYALDEVDLAMKRLGESVELYYYKGEGHRLMAEDPRGAAIEQAMRRLQTVDDKAVAAFQAEAVTHRDAARRAYRKTLSIDPSFGTAHRGLGFLAFNEGDKEKAKMEFETYLNMSKNIWDYKYIRKILEELSK